MKISWRLIVLGVVAYLMFLLIALPADVVLSRLQSRGIAAVGVSGSVWNGRAAAMQIGRFGLGSVEWHVSPWRLFTGKLSTDLRAKRDDGALQASVSIGFGKRAVVKQMQGSLPIAALSGFGLPSGWQGTVNMNMSLIELQDYWPVSAVGTIDATNLVGPAYQPMQIGNFRVDFAGNQSASDLAATLSSTGDGPFDVVGTLHLRANRSYEIDAQVGTRPGAPEQAVKGLQYLGEADAQGRRPFTMAGTL
jgi:general secretion pathway protein N